MIEDQRRSMRIAIHQPNYIPWCGYFAKMRACDVFVFLDDAQFSPGSYTNRVQIASPRGPRWLTVPVKHGGLAPIHAVRIADAGFAEKHLHALQSEYGRAPHFREVFPIIEPIYHAAGDRLSDLNMRLIRALAKFLKIDCDFRVSSKIGAEVTGDDRLIELVRKLGGDTYVSGPGGEKYQDQDKFAAAGVSLAIHTYRPVPYPQRRERFTPGLSMLDALFNAGSQTRDLLVYS